MGKKNKIRSTARGKVSGRSIVESKDSSRSAADLLLVLLLRMSSQPTTSTTSVIGTL
jgi:hypothetical protein